MRLSKPLSFLLCCLPLLAAGPALAQQDQEPVAESSSLPVDVVYCISGANTVTGPGLDEIKNFLAENTAAYARYSAQGNLRVGRVLFRLQPDEKGATEAVIPLNDDLNSVQDNFDRVDNPISDHSGISKVLRLMTEKMGWRKESYKVVYILGNDLFPGDYQTSVSAAARKGIHINPIYVGPLGLLLNLPESMNQPSGGPARWVPIAELGQGNFFYLDILEFERHTKSPYLEMMQGLKLLPHDRRDVLIRRLQLNNLYRRELADAYARFTSTYVPYGPDATQGAGYLAMTLINIDMRGFWPGETEPADPASPVVLNLKMDHGDWDLVDAARRGVLDWTQIDEATLPEEIRNMNARGRNAYLQSLYARRTEVLGELLILEKEWQKALDDSIEVNETRMLK